MDNIVEIFIRRNRFFVKTKTHGTLPRANYVWLKNNPVFKSIPTGYVIHHLDGDSTNDDISNLVIMYKLHHVAHHFKHKRPDTAIQVFLQDVPESFSYKRPPWVEKHGNRWYAATYQKGEKIRFKVNYNDDIMRTEEEARAFADEIFRRSKGLQTQIAHL